MQALVLHSRSYKENSALVDFFSLDLGIVRAVMRNARSKSGSLVRPFCIFDLELRGKHELKTVASLEQQQVFWLKGVNLFCAMYLNELLIRLIPTFDPNQIIFTAYLKSLENLQSAQKIEPILREFELILLKELGYALVFTHDTDGNYIKPDCYYSFNPAIGLVKSNKSQIKNDVLGEYLLAIEELDWHLPNVLAVAKNIIRKALAIHLGDKPLLSRNLFLASN